METPFKDSPVTLKLIEEHCDKCGSQMTAAYIRGQQVNRYCAACIEAEDKKRAREEVEQGLKAQQVKQFNALSVFSNSDLKHASFETFEVTTKEQEQAKQLMREAYKAVIKNQPIHAMLIGKVGRGKSHVAIAFAREVLKTTSKSVCFVNWRNMQEMKTMAYNANYGDLKLDWFERFERIKEVDVLVIDDLGAELGTNVTDRDAKKRDIENLMDARTNKTTIITTNVTRQELNDIYGPRFISRYKACGGSKNIVEMVETKDYRGEL